MSNIQLTVDGVVVYSSGTPVPTPPPTPGPVPPPPTPAPPPGAGPEATIAARAAVGQNCLWNLLTSEEEVYLLNKHGPVIHQYVQFYSGGGSGGMNVQERVNPASVSGFSFVNGNQQWQDDVGGAADAYVLALASSQGRGVPMALS